MCAEEWVPRCGDRTPRQFSWLMCTDGESNETCPVPPCTCDAGAEYESGSVIARYSIIISTAVALTMLFVANRRYAYPESVDGLPLLTPAHIVDPRYAGRTFRLEGRVTSVGESRQGLLIIEVHDAAEDLSIDVPVFPSLGCLLAKPMRGETVRVTGNLGMYSGRAQLRPLSAAHVELATEFPEPVSAAAAAEQGGARLLIGPVVARDTEFFESRAGLEHLRLTLADADASTDAGRGAVAGIMFGREQTHCETDRLLSGDPVMVTAEVEQYLGAPSLVVRRVLPLR